MLTEGKYILFVVGKGKDGIDSDYIGDYLLFDINIFFFKFY